MTLGPSFFIVPDTPPPRTPLRGATILTTILLLFGLLTTCSTTGLFFRLNDLLLKNHMDHLTRRLFRAYQALTILFFACCLGVLAADTFHVPYLLETVHALLVVALLSGSFAALAGGVADLRLAKANHITNLSIVRTLVNMVEARDHYLKGHSMHVAAIVMLMYRQMPTSLRKRYSAQRVEYAALLHDIGKLGISEDILNKPGKLDEVEISIMRQHPAIAKDILMDVPGLEDILDWICYHHERADGKGYYGLSGEETPFVSKLIAVADTYSAIVMCRPYKPRRAHHEAMKIMESCAGTQLDLYAFELFRRVAQDQVDECLAMLQDIECLYEIDSPAQTA